MSGLFTTNVPTNPLWRPAGNRFHWALALLICSVWLAAFPEAGRAQGTGAFLEEAGFLVMEAESITPGDQWKVESSEAGYTGAAYLRYNGGGHFQNPNNTGVAHGLMAYTFVISNPGTYRMWMRLSHLGAPAPDQDNDCWTRLDDGEWVKTFHPSSRMDEGFTFHSFLELHDPVEIVPPEYYLEAGTHTFYVAARSNNLKIDRIHFWRTGNEPDDKEPPFVTFDKANDPNQPESERDGVVTNPALLSVTPSPVVFPAQAVGVQSNELIVSLANDGTETLTVDDLTLSGDHADDFSIVTTLPLEIPAGGVGPVQMFFTPSASGIRNAELTVTHDGINTPVVVSVRGSGLSGGAGSQVLFRVNAGGPEIEDTPMNWAEDQSILDGNGAAGAGTPHPYVNAEATGDKTFGRDDVVTLDPSVPAGIPMALFQRGRWDPTPTPGMQWDIPIEAGTELEVRLYLAEQYFFGPDSPPGEGPRVFDVSIEGVVPSELDDLNMFEAYGHDVGFMYSTNVVSDGNIDIDFINATHDPIIQGIEILEVGGENTSNNLQPLIEGWNMVGLPLTVADAGYTALFGDNDPVTAPFLYNGSDYEETESLEQGEGYWLKVETAGKPTYTGTSLDEVTLDLTAGWNMVSGPDCALAWEAVSDPGDILLSGSLYGYGNGYVAATSFASGLGYWVEANADGSVTLTCGTVAEKRSSSPATPYDEGTFGKLVVTDTSGGTQMLLFAGTLDGTEEQSYKLPPLPPEGFDARFSDNTWLTEEEESLIQIRTDAFPVTIQVERLPFEGDVEYTLYEWVAGTDVAEHELVAGTEIVVTNEQVTGLRLAPTLPDVAVENGNLPDAFRLLGNYPNPFNPTTTVAFDLPTAASVDLEVYDLLGRRVLTVPARDLAAGAGQRLTIDAGSLASGTYVYRLRAVHGNSVNYQTGRMTLLK